MQNILIVFTVLGLSTAFALPAAAGFGTIQRISILTSDCTDCGMTLLGQVNLKICGGAPERCCSVVNIGNFDSGMFNEGAIDNYSGGHLLEGCFNYNLSNSTSASDLSLTVYHEGSDGGQLDWVEIHTESRSVRCPMGFWMDSFSSMKVACVEQ
eukprot:GFUD01014792.1.p1 GENE.GFUD01014792.1~~GFUD01014792.1.p1  ORF type:complete len:154 (+),score=28.67 GFUD01014792.1:39-500(+)